MLPCNSPVLRLPMPRMTVPDPLRLWVSPNWRPGTICSKSSVPVMPSSSIICSLNPVIVIGTSRMFSSRFSAVTMMTSMRRSSSSPSSPGWASAAIGAARRSAANAAVACLRNLNMGDSRSPIPARTLPQRVLPVKTRPWERTHFLLTDLLVQCPFAGRQRHRHRSHRSARAPRSASGPPRRRCP